jgi:hypothetical protein
VHTTEVSGQGFIREASFRLKPALNRLGIIAFRFYGKIRRCLCAFATRLLVAPFPELTRRTRNWQSLISDGAASERSFDAADFDDGHGGSGGLRKVGIGMTVISAVLCNSI